ncbi:MAG: M28 family peptidase [Bacteroidota bacterium]|nr:M28 family peptidase [Bacteroidota bacterium]
MLRTSVLLLTFVCLASGSFAQKLKKSDKAIIGNLQSHVSFLADDKLEGRRAGTNGEKLAMEYIADQFSKTGLVPKGDNNGWFQAFEINDGKEIAKETYLLINGGEIKPPGYFPFIGSPDKAIEAAPSIALRESGMPWFLNLKEALELNKTNPHFDLADWIVQQEKDAAKKKATALIVYNSGEIEDGLSFNGKEKTEPLAIPVLYVSKDIAKKYFSDESATLELKLRAVFNEKKRIGHNVIGFINNNAATTIIAGAHFDHLGYGEDNNSMYRGPEKLIHNGADDNASGTAALIELAKLLKSSKLKNSNYLFIAFSGEELGLFGSKYFTEHPTTDLSKVNYMVNMDMVGRLNDSSKTITVGGYGTSPAWGSLLPAIKNENFANKYDSSGTGPSDHTSFYRKDIPVLFFFTGVHSDYHRPTDDADKINYTGEYRILQYIYKIIESTNKKDRLVFTKTRETSSVGSVRLNVTMGIMPDYAYSGNGVRADGVSEGKPAQKAGLKTGDVIIQLGEYPVLSVENYMQVLNKFKKGDKTKVKYKRGTETLEADVQF